MQIRPYRTQDTETIIKLWTACGLTRPWNDPYLDIQRKLKVNPEWFLVGLVGDEIVACAMFGYEGHRGWVNYLAVSPRHQRQGYARQMMKFGENMLLAAGCPKINLQIRRDNAQVSAFYEALGYQADETISLGKRLIPDE
jgi:ribosomal protein S18 acetylase RimI-like enzyme